LKKASEVVNITDISPLHSKWVNKFGKGLKDEIRLAKQFCKANKLYGAESHITGFSGYVLEILTIHYKGFKNLIKAITKWKPKVIIDTEKYHKKPLFDLDKSKTHSPIIIIDPVQKSRNASAAVDIEKFNKLIQYSKEFLKSLF